MAVPDPPMQAAILQAARVLFTSSGYARTTMKSVAAAAGVAPGVVTSLYANKERLFAAALRLPVDPTNAVPELIAPGLDGMGERLVRMSLELLDDPKVREDIMRLARSDAAATLASDPDRAGLGQLRAISDFVQSTIIDRVVSAVGVPDARLRVSLISSYLLGVTTTRSILRIEPLASASRDQLVAMMAPTVQDLLDPTTRRA